MMTNSFSNMFVAPLAVLVLCGFVLTPVAQAVGERGGGRAQAAGGGGARANAGGGRQAVQANNNRADVRTNDVRSNSVNNVNSRNTNINANRNTNVNANRNVNVNVSGNSGCCGNGWDNDYHPVAGAMAVAGAVAVTSAVVGSMVNTVPANCVPVNYGGMVYQQCGSQWYQPQGSQYVVVNPPY